MATFKCLASGNLVSFTLDHDIKTMETHPGYVRVDAPKESIVAKEESLPVPNRIVMGHIPVVTKRPGRPRRVAL
jgi:hypothetical protein